MCNALSVCRLTNAHDLPHPPALHITCGAQHASSVRLLLDAGAAELRDSNGQLARHLTEHPLVIQAFEEHGS